MRLQSGSFGVAPPISAWLCQRKCKPPENGLKFIRHVDWLGKKITVHRPHSCVDSGHLLLAAMAALSLSTSSLTRPLLPAVPAKAIRRATVLCSARFKQHQFIRCRNLLPAFFKADRERGIDVFSQPNSDSDTIVATELWEQCRRFIATTTLGASVLMVAFPANALLTMETLPDFLDAVIISVISAFLYFLVVPVLIYYYLYKRWFKRRMAEAILQFGLVFLFFPGMLLLAPFINFRGLPKEGAKEPWDEIRPS